jgi:hypothetical protein
VLESDAVRAKESKGRVVTDHGKSMDWASVAENADAYLTPSPMAERELRTDVVLLHGRDGRAWSNLASRIRFDEATVEPSIAATRRWFTDRDVGEFRWLIGPLATPRGVASLLLERGASPDDDEPELTAMVLDREPPAVPGVVVRAVTTLTDYLRMEEIREAVFGSREIDEEERRARWSQFERAGALAYLALDGGTPVSFGS